MHRDKRVTRHTLSGDPGSDIIDPDPDDDDDSDDDDDEGEPLRTDVYRDDDGTVVIDSSAGNVDDDDDDDDDAVDHEERDALDYFLDDDYNVCVQARGYLMDGPGDEVEGRITVPSLIDELGDDYNSTADTVVGTFTWAYYRDRMTLRRTSATSAYNPNPDIPDGCKVGAVVDDGYFIVSDPDSSGSDGGDVDDSPEPLTGGWEGLDWDEYMLIRDAKTIDPAPGQHRLKDFESATQVSVNPDAVDVGDERIEDLPAFVDTDAVGALSKYHPGTGDKMVCDHCGAHHPWDTPLERGVEGVRGGGIDDGDPSYDHCDPDDTEIKRCSCCGCPRCDSKSIRYRSSSGDDDADFACNHCQLEFDHPVSIDGVSDDADRAKLLWECKFCGGATRAPFRGVPADLL